MSQVNFTIVVNLSNFFNDHRHRARVFINEKIKTIDDLQNKITDIFGVRNFFLTSQNEFLPPSEDVRILHAGDILWVIPSTNSRSLDYNEEKEEVSRKRKVSKSKHSIENISPKRKSKKHSTCESSPDDVLESQGSKENKRKKSVNECTEQTSISKKLKKKYKHYDTLTDLDLVQTDNQKSNDIPNIECKSPKYKQNNTHTISEDTQYSDKNTPESQKETASKIDKNIKKSIKKIKTLSNSYQSSKVPRPLTVTNKELSVNVASSISNIPYKKVTPVPTITDEYLKEKKINIVKIDYISKPMIPEPPEDIPPENIPHPETQECIKLDTIWNKKENNQTSHLSTLTISDNKKMSDSVQPEIAQNNDVTDNVGQHYCKTSSTLPTTKFFFLPDSGEKRKPLKVTKEKRENVFKHKKDLLISFLSENDSIHQTSLQCNNIHEASEKHRLEEKGKHSPKTEDVQVENNFNFKNNLKLNNNSSINSIGSTVSKEGNDKQEEFVNPHETFILSPIPKANPISHNINHLGGLIYKTGPDSNISIQQQSIDTQDHQSLNNEQICNNTVENELESNVEDVEGNICLSSSKIPVETVEVSVENNLPGFGKLSTAILQDSCYINKISPCITSFVESNETGLENNELEVSGLKRISYWGSKRNISGVGHLLDSIRKSETESVLDTTTSDGGEFVTTRKRNRTRKRQKNKSKQNVTLEETITPKPNFTPMPIKTSAAPKMHIKFCDDDEKSQLSEKNESIISIGSENGDMPLFEENILKSPLMSQIVPKVGDVIAFKILKITADFTPNISSHIIGHVKHFSKETKMITFEITYGLSELQPPEGKFSLNQRNENVPSKYQDYLWSDLIEPRLIYP